MEFFFFIFYGGETNASVVDWRRHHSYLFFLPLPSSIQSNVGISNGHIHFDLFNMVKTTEFYLNSHFFGLSLLNLMLSIPILRFEDTQLFTWTHRYIHRNKNSTKWKTFWIIHKENEKGFIDKDWTYCCCLSDVLFIYSLLFNSLKGIAKWTKSSFCHVYFVKWLINHSEFSSKTNTEKLMMMVRDCLNQHHQCVSIRKYLIFN